MASVQSSVDLQNSEPNNLRVYVTRFLKQLLTQFNGNIQFRQNIKSSSLLTVLFSQINVDTTFTHDLGKSPQGYILVGATVPAVLYSGDVPWTPTTMTLRSNAIGTVFLFVI